MEFWDWFQIVVAVMIGNAFFAAFAIGILAMYRHEVIKKRSEETIPFWVYPLMLVPMGLAIIVVAGLSS